MIRIEWDIAFQRPKDLEGAVGFFLPNIICVRFPMILNGRRFSGLYIISMKLISFLDTGSLLMLPYVD